MRAAPRRMPTIPRTRCAAVLLSASLLGALAPTSALAGQSDLTATEAYIQANSRFVHAAASRIHPMEAALQSLLGQVRAECPEAAAGSPEDTDSEQLSNEVIGAMVLRAGSLIRPAAEAFLAAAGHLAWSDGRLTRVVHGYLANVRALSDLAQPRLCSDVQTWAASGFRTLPASTAAFDAVFMANWVAAGELPAALAPYETPAERPLLNRTTRLESELTELEAREAATWREIMNTLELEP